MDRQTPQIYKTADGGSTWGLASQQIPTPGDAYTLSFPQGEVPNPDEGNGYIDAYSPLFTGTKRADGLMLLERRNGETTSMQVYRTHDEGQTWTPAEKMGNSGIHICSFVDDNDGYGLDDTGKLFTTSDGGLHWVAVAAGSPQISMMVETNTTAFGYDALPLLWNIGQNVLQSSDTPVVHADGADNREYGLRWSSSSPLLAVQYWNGGNAAIFTATSDDVHLLVPRQRIRFASVKSGPRPHHWYALSRWYAPEENAFVTVPMEFAPIAPKTTLDGTTFSVTEYPLASSSTTQVVGTLVPSGLTQITVLYGSGGFNNGFVLVEASEAGVADTTSSSLWLFRIKNGITTWARCGDTSSFGGGLIGDQDPGFARVGSLLYITHAHGKIGCIDTAAASPTVTWPEKINILLAQLYREGPTAVEAPLQASLASDNGILILGYPDAGWNDVYYALDKSGTVLGSLQVD